jgi:hypothetical protein
MGDLDPQEPLFKAAISIPEPEAVLKSLLTRPMRRPRHLVVVALADHSLAAKQEARMGSASTLGAKVDVRQRRPFGPPPLLAQLAPYSL